MYQLQTFKIRILPSIFGLLTIRMSSLCCLCSIVSSFDFHFHWLKIGWSSELLLACLRASRSLAPTQGNLESVWELDSMSATSKKRTSRGYPTISWLWAGLEVSANIYFRTKRSLFWEDSRDVSHFLFTSHIFGGIHALKKLKVKMIWFQRDLFIPSLGCSYQRVHKTKWTKINEHEHIFQNVLFLANPSGWSLKFQSLILQMALWEGQVRSQFDPKSMSMLGFGGYLSMMMTYDIMDLKLNEFEIRCIFYFRAGQSKI